MSEKLSELFDGLFPAWPTIVATIISFLILLFILTKLVYKPVRKNYEDRRNYIQKNINNAEMMNEEAIVDREHANNEIMQARINAADIVETAKKEAEDLRHGKILATEHEINLLHEEAKKDIEFQKVKFEAESKKMMVEIALDAASKVIEKEINSKSNNKIVEDFINSKIN